MFAFRSETTTRPGASTTSVAILVLLVLSIIITFAIFWGVGRQTQLGKDYITLTAEQQLLSRSIVSQAFEASQGAEDAFVRLQESRDRFDETLDRQKNLSLPSAILASVNALEAQWQPVRNNIGIILNGRQAVLSVSDFLPLMDEIIPRLLQLSNDIADGVVGSGASSRQVYFSTRQLLLIQRIESSLNRMLAGGTSAAAAADQFVEDVDLFERVLQGLQQGDRQLGVDAVRTTAIAERIDQLSELFQSVRDQAGLVPENSPELFQVQEATRAIAEQSDDLFATTTRMLNQYTESDLNSFELLGIPVNVFWAYVFGGLALALLLLLARQQNRETRSRLIESEQRKQETEEQNRRNQEAILRLLDELGDLAEGDLTVQATVTEDITGAIADSVNYAIEALRALVSTINITSEQMAAAAHETRNVADRLARSSEEQTRQIETSSDTIMKMAQSMDDVSAKTASSAEVAEKSVSIAHEGGDRVRRTIQGMDAIREHIQETSKRIKRLGESSQEIGDIVALINDIADQTNILALNAAIQASAAGEAGRGFAVVADEVQRLAERSGNATKRIEALVKTIQADTNEAIISMEKSTTEVVNGAELAEKAGEALDEIETVSARLAELINEVSKAAGQVTEMASKVSNAMISINQITAQTSEGSVVTATSIGKLNQLAQELQQSVSGFRLPTSAGGQY